MGYQQLCDPTHDDEAVMNGAPDVCVVKMCDPTRPPRGVRTGWVRL